jgi:hypothetical protein
MKEPEMGKWDGPPLAGEKWVIRKRGTRWAGETRHVVDRTLGGDVVFVRGRLSQHGGREVVSLDTWNWWARHATRASAPEAEGEG